MESNTRSRYGRSPPGAALLALAAVTFAAAASVCQAADRPAFVGSVGGARGLVSSGVARAPRKPLSRKPEGRSGGRLSMQEDGDAETYDDLPTVFADDRPKTYTLKPGQVGVRFINTSGDPDVAVAAYPGEIVTNVAKRAGVKISTACNSGLCGTCTTDLEDENAKSYRPGFGVVRACVTPVTLVAGAEEMVLDVYRNRSKKGNLNKQLTNFDDEQMEGLEVQTLGDAMKRFEDGWDEEFEPNYGGAKKNAGGGTFGHNMDLNSVKPMLSPTTQRRMENKGMYDDLPSQAKRRVPSGGREFEHNMDEAHQISLRQRLQRERRARVNFYLDNAKRPIATADEVMMMTQEEVDSRSRFYNNQPTKWQEAYGPANLPEFHREFAESNGRRSEGASSARMALYRSVRQIPRYRFHGDPPLKDTDKVIVKNYLSKELERVDPFTAAHLDRQEMMREEEVMQNNKFVWRDSRTGREVHPIKAGKPTTQRRERREVNLPTCVSCEGTGTRQCSVCFGTGINPSATGLHDLVCPRCNGHTKVICETCNGTGFGSTGMP